MYQKSNSAELCFNFDPYVVQKLRREDSSGADDDNIVGNPPHLAALRKCDMARFDRDHITFQQFLDLAHQVAAMDMARVAARAGLCVVAVLHDLLQNFAFADRADFASWLAALLSPLVKSATNYAPSPLLCVSASSPGASSWSSRMRWSPR